MIFIETVGIHASALGLRTITEGVYPFAEECWDCSEYLPIEGYRHTCYRCV